MTVQAYRPTTDQYHNYATHDCSDTLLVAPHDTSGVTYYLMQKFYKFAFVCIVRVVNKSKIIFKFSTQINNRYGIKHQGISLSSTAFSIHYLLGKKV